MRKSKVLHLMQLLTEDYRSARWRAVTEQDRVPVNVTARARQNDCFDLCSDSAASYRACVHQVHHCYQKKSANPTVLRQLTKICSSRQRSSKMKTTHYHLTQPTTYHSNHSPPTNFQDCPAGSLNLERRLPSQDILAQTHSD